MFYKMDRLLERPDKGWELLVRVYMPGTHSNRRDIMKRQTVSFLCILALGLCLFSVQGMAADKTYIMTGEITAINTQEKIVVIDVPLEKGIFTVAGPLVGGADLKKGGQTATLSDFKVGERVTVKWKGTSWGHVIESLKGR